MQEKEFNLRTGMRTMGLSSAVYWTTWWLQGQLFIIIATLALMGSAAMCQFDVFLRSNQFVVFLAFYLYGNAIVAVAFCFSAFLQRLQTAQAVGYGMILLGFVFQAILTSNYGVFLDILYSDDVPAWVVFLRWVFIQYPPSNFALIYSDIAKLSGNTIDGATGSMVAGKGFFWKDLWISQSVPLGGIDYESPAPYMALVFLLYDAGLWYLLGWYFNNVLGEGALPWYFLFTRQYWGIDKCQARRSLEEVGAVLGEYFSLGVLYLHISL